MKQEVAISQAIARPCLPIIGSASPESVNIVGKMKQVYRLDDASHNIICVMTTLGVHMTKITSDHWNDTLNHSLLQKAHLIY